MNERAVLRFELDVNDETHTLPAGKVVFITEHRRIHRTERHGRIEVWVEVTLASHKTSSKTIGTQTVRIFGTGHLISDGATHLGTTLDGPLVWHLYQLPETHQEG